MSKMDDRINLLLQGMGGLYRIKNQSYVLSYLHSLDLVRRIKYLRIYICFKSSIPVFYVVLMHYYCLLDTTIEEIDFCCPLVSL